MICLRISTTKTTGIVRLVVIACLALLICVRAYSQEPLPLTAEIVGREFVYEIQAGDSLTSVGARFGVPARTLASANDIAGNAHLKGGQQLRIDNRHILPPALQIGITINIPQRMLFYAKDGRLLHHFPVGLGRPDWPTPTGSFKVVVKEENPVWDVPSSIQEEMRREGKPVQTCVPPGPKNPLGKHWLGLSRQGYGIHGTIAPASIYQFRTHGCVRLHPDDIAALFATVSPGTPVSIMYQRVLVAKIGNQLFLEVHPDVYAKQPEALKQLHGVASLHKLAEEIDWERAKDIIRRQDGVARVVKRGEPSGDAAK